MKQVKQTNLFEGILEVQTPVAPQDPLTILQELKGNCKNCRLGVTSDKTNDGIIYAGNPNARVAIVGDMPEISGTMLTKRLPIAGEPQGRLQGWLKALDMHEEDIFFINVVQCKTSKGKAKDAEILAPFNEEIDACFPFRALRVLQANTKLEVVITLGWIAAGALIGRVPEPRQKSHEGQWFGTGYGVGGRLKGRVRVRMRG